MPVNNVDLVRRGYYEARIAATSTLSSASSTRISSGGIYLHPRSRKSPGRDEVREWLERFLDAWEEMDVQIVEVVEADDKVAALVRLSGRGKGAASR